MDKLQHLFHGSVLKHCLGKPIHKVTPLKLQDCPKKTNMDEFNLEDKADFQKGSNVVKSIDTSVNLDDKEDVTGHDFFNGTLRHSNRSIVSPKR